jgi:glycosyltransferase involved in cell wall biosynthesis
MIRDGVTGVLVPPHDPDALAGAIVRVLTDHPFADTIARAGRVVVHDRFCVERMVSAIEGVYEEGAIVARERGVMATARGRAAIAAP